MLTKTKLKQSITCLLIMTIIAVLSGCATSSKIQPVQIGDNQLTKEQLLAEINRLDQSQQSVDSNKGVTGTNVAAALFWLPGLAYTYYDAGEATRLIEQRRAHLTSLYNQKMAQEGRSRTRG